MRGARLGSCLCCTLTLDRLSTSLSISLLEESIEAISTRNVNIHRRTSIYIEYNSCASASQSSARDATGWTRTRLDPSWIVGDRDDKDRQILPVAEHSGAKVAADS